MKPDPFQVKKRCSKALRSLPNVVGIGVGPKEINGEPTNIMAIKVYVRSKVPKEQLAPGECVADEIEGIPTDIVEQPSPMHAY